MTPHETLTAFLETVHPTADGFCELRALPSTARTFVPAGDVDGVADFVRDHRHENCYLGVATRGTPTTGTLENCTELWTLFVDLDFKTVPEGEARHRLAVFPLPPSLVVHSGGGLHCYWQLREPMTLPADADAATSLLRRLAQHFGGDLASAEPVRVLRVPNSFNYKREYGGARAVQLETHEGAAYNATELAEWLPSEPKRPNGSHAATDAPFTVPPTIRDGQRNDVLYRSARSMHAKGWSGAAILAALTAENAERCAPPLPQHEVEAIAAHATGQADRSDFASDAPPPDPGRGLDAAALSDATVVAAEGLHIAATGVKYLVDGLIPDYGVLGKLVAFAKVGKTTFGLALGAAVASGQPFLNRDTRQARVLIIAAEDPPEYTAFLARHLTLPAGALTFFRHPIVLDAAGLAQIAATVTAGRYGFVLIASWQAVVRGLIRDENDNAGAVRVVEAVKAVTRATHIPWLIDAHSGKGEDQGDDADPSKAMRGASSAAAAADYTLSLRYSNGPFHSLRRLSGKGRFVTLAPLVLDYNVTTGDYTLIGSTKDTTIETTWRLIVETGVLTPTPQTAGAIARTAGLIGPSGRVNGTAWRQVSAALRRRPGVRSTTETRRGQLTVLYARQEDES